jgi:hypothetical protein
MARAADNTKEAQMPEEVSSRPDLLAVPPVISDHPVTQAAPNEPQWAIIREIDFRIDQTVAGKELVFYYSRYKKILPVPLGTFQTLLTAICQPGYGFDGGPSIPAPPLHTSLSLDSHKELAYVIFKLAPGSEAKPGRWQFARNGWPIKIGDAGHAANAYYDANRVDPQGQADPGDPGVIKDGCQVAYFISDGVRAYNHGSYPHPFNLYVDLLVANYEPMPIRIDPDIRHPGGSPE